jgi:dTDP-4-dehydrorhamnose reductase
MYLVTGGSGQLGRELIKTLTSAKMRFLAPNRSEFDLEDFNQMRSYLKDNRFSAILHLGADTNVDGCESDRTGALKRNFLATKILAEYAQIQGIRIVFTSSSAVMAGRPGSMHHEDLDPAPANFYGYSKLLAEKFIQEHNSNYLIVRAGWMLGNSGRSPKFVEQITARIRSRDKILAVDDRFGSITSASRLAGLISAGAQKLGKHTMHFASNTECSRYELSLEIAKIIKMRADINPVPNGYFKLLAPRGLSEGLLGERSFTILGVPTYSWQEELRIFFEELKSNKS